MTSATQAATQAERQQRRASIHQAQDAFTLAAAQLTELPTDETLASALVLGAIALVHLSKADPDEWARKISEDYVRAIQENRRP